jgi:hypothetical protein
MRDFSLAMTDILDVVGSPVPATDVLGKPTAYGKLTRPFECELFR